MQIYFGGGRRRAAFFWKKIDRLTHMGPRPEGPKIDAGNQPIAPPHYKDLGAIWPQKMLVKISAEIAYFHAFLHSGGTSAVKEPGNFEVKRSSRLVRSPRVPNAAKGSPDLNDLTDLDSPNKGMIPPLCPSPRFFFLFSVSFLSLPLPFFFQSHLYPFSSFLSFVNLAKGSGDRYKLPQWGLGRSPSCQQFLDILIIKTHLKPATAITDAINRAVDYLVPALGRGGRYFAPKRVQNVFVYLNNFFTLTYLGAWPHPRTRWALRHCWGIPPRPLLLSTAGMGSVLLPSVDMQPSVDPVV